MTDTLLYVLVCSNKQCQMRHLQFSDTSQLERAPRGWCIPDDVQHGFIDPMFCICPGLSAWGETALKQDLEYWLSCSQNRYHYTDLLLAYLTRVAQLCAAQADGRQLTALQLAAVHESLQWFQLGAGIVTASA